jgi:pimeloyl-ACP methyl ester carboxylesterase
MVITSLLQAVNRVFFGPVPEGPAEGDELGLVLMADGVGGLDLCARGLCHMVSRSGLGLDVRVFRWSHGFGRWYADLSDVVHHRDRSQRLAAEILAYRERRPDKPVYLVAKSGGCGLVTWALERLPAGSVEKAILIAPALSPGYNLGPALRAIRDEIVVFWSPFDVFILGAGTIVFKTIDRVRSPAAGMRGFRVPDDPALRAKLRQIRWRPGMMRRGYFGGHVGPDNPFFLRDYVLPLIDSRPMSDSRAGARLESSRAGPGPIT